MPIYVVRCVKCKQTEDIYRSFKDFDDLPKHCGERVERVIVPSYSVPDIKPYQSVVTGEVVGGRRQHREYLKRNNLVEIGNEYRPPKPIPRVGGVREDIRNSYRQLSRKS